MQSGIFQLVSEALDRGVDIRILIPAAQDELKQIVNELNLSALSHKIHIRSIDKSLQTSIGILVVDRTESLIIESRDDTKDDYLQSVGLAAYSNSRPIATSYASIFESLWKHTELYEQLQVYNIMQEEFINIAAHELRTPIQPILGLSQMLRLKLKNSENIGFLDIIVRNANRLQRLTEDILDVQKIESRTLKLNKERFDLNDLILSVVDDYKNQIGDQNRNLKLIQQLDNASPMWVEGDKYRIIQVISNLLGNTLKFAKDGTVLVNAKNDRKSNEVVVSVKDTGQGLDPEILPRLFSKFASKSFQGTCLGLFISKGIVEAHGVKM